MNSAHAPNAPPSLVSWTNVIYALHALSIVVGIVGTATVIGAFLTGWPSLIAVIMNYIKRGEARGTWLDSHFRWQFRTFWFGVLWVVPLVTLIVLSLGIALIVLWLPLALVTLWFIYRITRGWLALRDRRPMYV